MSTYILFATPLFFLFLVVVNVQPLCCTLLDGVLSPCILICFGTCDQPFQPLPVEPQRFVQGSYVCSVFGLRGSENGKGGRKGQKREEVLHSCSLW